MRLAWPLTGRADELRLIEVALADSDSAGVIVRGAAGVGKSRIAREALAAADSGGYAVRWVGATSSAKALPLGAFGPWAPSTVADTRVLVRGTIEALTSARATVVVGVDDAHLLDDLSIYVVHQVVLRRAAKVVLTVRDGEPIPQGLQEVWRGGQFDRVDLRSLSPDETADLLAATLGGLVDPDAARRLSTLTDGNVLYLRNIVEQEVVDGRLRQQRGSWRWTGDPIMPPGLVELVETRIGAVPTAVSTVVDALAVGEPIELTSLSRIIDLPAIEEAEVRGLITLDTRDGLVEVRLAHPLYGEVRRKRAPATSLRRLRGLVVTELANGSGGDDIRTVVRRASLSLESDLDTDAALLLRAAQGAVWLADLPLAERLAKAAIGAGAGPEASFVRAHALSIVSRGEEALAALGACPRDQLTDADQARLAFLRSHIMLFTLADHVGAKRLIDHAALATPPQVRGCIDAFLALYWAVLGKPEEAIRLASDFILEELPAVIGAGTAMAMSVAYGDAGRTTEAIAAANVGYSVSQHSFDAAQMRFVIAEGHIGALLQAGRVGEARDIADRLQRQAVDLPGTARLFSSGQVGMTALAAGQLDTACAVLEPVVDAFRASGDTNGWGYRYHLLHTVALSMRGAFGAAAAAFAELALQRHPTWRYLDYEYSLAQAWVAAAEGATSNGIATVRAAAENARNNCQLAAEVLCLQAASQFGDRTCGSRLKELAAIVEGPRAAVAMRFAVALHDRDGGGLAAASHEYEQMGDRVAAVDAAAHAALAYREKGLRGSGWGCSVRARELGQACGGALTPALRLVAEPLPLTDREREIAMLVAEGLSNREIAERLVVSVRTVESHLYKAMARTGTRRREEVAALLSRKLTPGVDGVLGGFESPGDQ